MKQLIGQLTCQLRSEKPRVGGSRSFLRSLADVCVCVCVEVLDWWVLLGDCVMKNAAFS